MKIWFIALALTSIPSECGPVGPVSPVLGDTGRRARRRALSPRPTSFTTSASTRLRLWPGWHYRFRFLATAYVMMLLSFGSMLLAVEAVIGLGNAAGPATAAAALYFFHGYHGSGTGAVCVLLTAGFATLLWFRFRRPART